MNVLDLAKTAYEANGLSIRTERGTEHDAFARITRRLKHADRDRDHTDFVLALHENRQLWTLLAAEVADKANRLPSELRAQIFYLAEFTDVHTSRVLNRGSDIDVLVEVNTAVMRGLLPGARR